MYPAALRDALRAAGIQAGAIANLGLTGRSDADLLGYAVEHGHVLLTENVGDFARLAAQHVNAGLHHPGVLIALSSRFSRRPAGLAALVRAICSAATDELGDRVVYLESA
jgi:hypothetical protein